MEPDTIVALSTPPGRGAIAVVRLSGAGARRILSQILGEAEGALPVRRPFLARITDPMGGGTLDRGLVTWFEGPSSYTGEDLAELSVHGGPLVSMLVVEACRKAGAREAEPGEFTRRAYLNGKLDLVQAEAVADLIEAGSMVSHRAAIHQVEGGLSQRVAELRQGLVELEALIMHHLDFPDEDEPPVTLRTVMARAGEVVERLDLLLETAPEGELLREGAVAVLAGRPNAGKSSLYNALLGEERAIVTAEAGTTRDALESRVSLGGFPFRLVDTAGLREDAGGIERMGIEVAQRYLEGADVILLCLPVDEAWSGAEAAFLQRFREGPPVVVVRTCADRDGRVAAPDVVADEGVEVSVRTGAGLAALRERLRDLVFGGLVEIGADAPLITRRRQRGFLHDARGEVAAFAEALDRGVPTEAACAHLRSAETALEEVLGVISPEEILDAVFSRFCIGK
ncbi:MAG: tRNA uridine-5-carboxymethylaminomethyl(34) synthesis GTPase MnmE [Gemmatimonadota bacterium]